MGSYLITGASRGIGRCLVDRLSPHHELIALGRDEKTLAALPVAERIVVDLSDASALATRVPIYPELDGVIHCAGIATRGALAASDVDSWHRHLEINVTAAAELTRLLLPGLRAARGSVVFVNSGQGLSASPNSTVYAATKFALRALADSLRAEEPDLRVSTVYPGRVATDMQRALRAQEGASYQPERYLQPETVAWLIHHILTTPADAVLTEVTMRPRS